MPVLFAILSGLLVDVLYSTMIGFHAIGYAVVACAVVIAFMGFKRINIVTVFLAGVGGYIINETVSAVMRNLDIFLDDSIADEFYSISRNYDTTMFYEPIISVKKIDGVKTCALYLNTLKDKSKEKEHYHNSISYSTQYNFDNTILSFIKQLVEKDVIKIFTNAYEVKKEVNI